MFFPVGILSWESFIFEGGGEHFLRRNLGSLTVQFVREAVEAFVFARVAKSSPLRRFPLRNNPRKKLSPPPPRL